MKSSGGFSSLLDFMTSQKNIKENHIPRCTESRCLAVLLVSGFAGVLFWERGNITMPLIRIALQTRRIWGHQVCQNGGHDCGLFLEASLDGPLQAV